SWQRDLELAVHDLDGVDRDRLVGRTEEDLARPDVELGAVAVADDPVLVEVAVGERALLVRAVVVERGPRSGVEVGQRDLAALDGHGAQLRAALRRPDARPPAHPRARSMNASNSALRKASDFSAPR